MKDDLNETIPEYKEPSAETDNSDADLNDTFPPAIYTDIGEEVSDGDDSENKNEVNSISADLIRGHINTIILRALYERDKYGYEIINDIESKSHGQYTLKQPTLYSALKRLERQGYIKAYWKTDEVTLGGRRKYFTLTESGQLITEKNLSEWEYSRTIIDSLISDRSFDFNNPAPTPVDFSILRDSVSRVPVVRSDETGRSESEMNTARNPPEQTPVDNCQLTPQQIIAKQDTETVESVQCVQTVQYIQLSEQTDKIAETKSAGKLSTSDEATVEPPKQSESDNAAKQEIQGTSTADNNAVTGQTAQEQPVQTINSGESLKISREEQAEEEARRRTHENYLKLISEPVRTKPQITEDVVPGSEKIDSDKLMYNNRPETERDYKNLIDGIFYKTVTNGSVQTSYHSRSGENTQRAQRQKAVDNSDLINRGRADGVSITPSNEANASHATKTTYNKGLTLLKSSAIVLTILILESIFCFIFMQELGVGWGYPTFILGIGLAQFAVFGILVLNGYGRNCVRPTGNGYISTCLILTIIGILIIAMLSFLFNMNASSASDIMKMLVIPSIVAVNVTVFALCFKLFLK